MSIRTKGRRVLQQTLHEPHEATCEHPDAEPGAHAVVESLASREQKQDGQDERHHAELPELHADVEPEERERKLPPREVNEQEAAGESEAVHEPERERDERAPPDPLRAR